MKKLLSFVVDESELEPGIVRLLSLLFLLLCGSLSWIEYVHEGWLFKTKLDFEPGLLSTAIAAVLIAPLYVRGILKWSKSVYGILSFVLLMLVFSSFVALATGGNTINKIVVGLLAAAVVLSWLGIRDAAGICWVLLIAAAVTSVLLADVAIRFAGYFYVTSAILGLSLHAGLSPGHLLQGIKDEYASDVIKIARQDMIALTGKRD